MDDQPFVGRGWAFPPTFSRRRSTVEMVSGQQDIEQSLQIIFTTSLGERLMRPDFGCSLTSEVFEVMNTGSPATDAADLLNSGRLNFLEHLLKTAILYHEPRIDARQIRLQPEVLEGRLKIDVDYVIRETNSRFNFVYDYYLREATG